MNLFGLTPSLFFTIQDFGQFAFDFFTKLQKQQALERWVKGAGEFLGRTTSAENPSCANYRLLPIFLNIFCAK